MFLLVWFLLEFAFWLYIRKTWIRLRQPLKPHSLPTFEQRWKLYWNCLDTIHVENFQDWITGWFYISNSAQREHPKLNEIYRDNLAFFLSWVFWGDDLKIVQKNPSFENELNGMIYHMETTFNIQFPTGYNSHVQCIRPTMDHFEYIHRPLLFYIINFIFTHIFDYLFLERFGQFRKYGVDHNKPGVRWGYFFYIFKKRTHDYYYSWWLKKQQSFTLNDKENHHHQHLTYWYRKGRTTSTSTTTPIIFIHGIGTGLHLYMDFIRRMTTLECPLFCIELPYVSTRLVEHVPTPKETVMEIQTMLDTHGFDKAIIVGHSLGTVVAGWMATYAMNRISGLVLIDPVCFLLNYHDTAYNMLHRIPSNFAEYLIHYFASRELHINYYFNRHFHWYLNNFFIHDIVPTTTDPTLLSSFSFSPFTSTTRSMDKHPVDSKKLTLFNHMKIYLSENDVIINSKQIAKYLNKYGMKPTMMSKLNHAEYLVRPQWLQLILSDIQQFYKTSTS
ncbi:hypothetical protein INT45_010273, partial [Circinella minor]